MIKLLKVNRLYTNFTSWTTTHRLYFHDPIHRALSLHERLNLYKICNSLAIKVPVTKIHYYPNLIINGFTCGGVSYNCDFSYSGTMYHSLDGKNLFVNDGTESLLVNIGMMTGSLKYVELSESVRNAADFNSTNIDSIIDNGGWMSLVFNTVKFNGDNDSIEKSANLIKLTLITE